MLILLHYLFKNINSHLYLSLPYIYLTTLRRVTSKLQCLVSCRIHRSDGEVQCQQRGQENLGFWVGQHWEPGDMKKAASESPGVSWSWAQPLFRRLAIFRIPGWKREIHRCSWLIVWLSVWVAVGRETAPAQLWWAWHHAHGDFSTHVIPLYLAAFLPLVNLDQCCPGETVNEPST